MPSRISLLCNASQPRTLAPDRPGASPSSPPGSRSTNEVIHGSERRQPCSASSHRTDALASHRPRAAARPAAEAVVDAALRISAVLTDHHDAPYLRRRLRRPSSRRTPPARTATQPQRNGDRTRSARCPQRMSDGRKPPTPDRPAALVQPQSQRPAAVRHILDPPLSAAVHRRRQQPAVRARLLSLKPLDDVPLEVPTDFLLPADRHDRNPSRPNNSVVASPMLLAPKADDSTPTTLRSHEPYALTTRRSPSTAKSPLGFTTCSQFKVGNSSTPLNT